jgi:hypothetical protein
VLECLNNEKPSAKHGRKNAEDLQELSCAFEPDGSTANQILDAPYPDWSVKPVIGKAFKPYSKFSDAPCNSRYGHADAGGFPIGDETAKTIVGFASGITTEELRGITWQGIRRSPEVKSLVDPVASLVTSVLIVLRSLIRIIRRTSTKAPEILVTSRRKSSKDQSTTRRRRRSFLAITRKER